MRMTDLNNWNTTRIRDFMRRLAKRQTTFDKNVAVLAAHVGISVKQFLNTDPISYGIMVWGFGVHNEPSPIIKKILGGKVYHECARLYYLKTVSPVHAYPPLPPSPPGTPEWRPSEHCQIPHCKATWCMTMPG